jgi:hypothetical protein
MLEGLIQLMKKCLNFKAVDRPTTDELINSLDLMLSIEDASESAAAAAAMTEEACDFGTKRYRSVSK